MGGLGQHPHYKGGFFSDVEDEEPIAYIINNNNDLINMLYISKDLFKTLVNIFSVEGIIDEMSLLLLIMEVAQDIIGNGFEIRSIDTF